MISDKRAIQKMMASGEGLLSSNMVDSRMKSDGGQPRHHQRQRAMADWSAGKPGFSRGVNSWPSQPV